MGNAWGVFSHSNERWAISHLCDSAASEPTSSSTSVCTRYLHFKGGPWETALHIYMWLATLNEHVKIGKLLVTDSEQSRPHQPHHTNCPSCFGVHFEGWRRGRRRRKKRYYIYEWLRLNFIALHSGQGYTQIPLDILYGHFDYVQKLQLCTFWKSHLRWGFRHCLKVKPCIGAMCEWCISQNQGVVRCFFFKFTDEQLGRYLFLSLNYACVPPAPKCAEYSNQRK